MVYVDFIVGIGSAPYGRVRVPGCLFQKIVLQFRPFLDLVVKENWPSNDKLSVSRRRSSQTVLGETLLMTSAYLVSIYYGWKVLLNCTGLARPTDAPIPTAVTSQDHDCGFHG